MPTLLDVARRAGVSTATVSKVLANKPYFTAATRDKVMQAVDELGYVPHLPARALSSGKTHIVAVVFPYLYDTIFTDPLVLRILEGIEAECSLRGYNILLSTPKLTANGPDLNYMQLMQSGYIEGLIAMDNIPSSSVIAPAQKRNLPSVAIGYYETEFSVQSDDFNGAHQLIDHVIHLGHRRIGFIVVAPERHYSIQYRMDGLRAGMRKAGLDFDAAPVAFGDFSTQSGFTAAQSLLQNIPDLTALVCINDRMAMGAIQCARQIGRDVPSDLTVVGYDDIPMAAAFSPALTTVDQQAPALGRAAAQMLFAVLDGKKPGSMRLPTYLVVRQSSASIV
jgi:DNA-binding LacI/PurR family transcriptional regulator